MKSVHEQVANDIWDDVCYRVGYRADNITICEVHLMRVMIYSQIWWGIAHRIRDEFKLGED